MITITPLSRVYLLNHLPKQAIVAEIGVWNGGFARQILQFAKPKKLHLIDPWGGADDPYVREYSITDDMQKKFEAVTRAFVNEVKQGLVEIHRTVSTHWATTVPDHALDWLYLDGLHTYEAVSSDLEALGSKVKPDGLILGHDFSNYRARTNFGVIRAVREYASANNYQIVLITCEDAPSFVLSKKPDGSLTKLLLKSVIAADPRILQVSERHLDDFDQVPYHLPTGERRFMMRFGAE